MFFLFIGNVKLYFKIKLWILGKFYYEIYFVYFDIIDVKCIVWIEIGWLVWCLYS